MLNSYYDKLKSCLGGIYRYKCWCCGPKPGKETKMYRRSKRRILKHDLKKQLSKDMDNL